MKITCAKKQLEKISAIAQRALPVRTTMPILEFVYLEAKDGKVLARGTDMTEGVETAASDGVSVIEEGACAVPAKYFSEMVRKLPDGTVTLSTDETGARISCGKAKFVLPCGAAEEYPAFPDAGDGARIVLKQADLKSAITRTAYAASKLEGVRKSLTSITFEAKDGLLSAVALDNHRVAQRVVPARTENGAPVRFLSPERSMSELARLLDADGDYEVTATIGATLASFRFGTTTFVARIVDDAPVSLARIENEERPTKATFRRTDLLECLERSMILCGAEDRRPLVFTIGNGEVEARIQNSVGGMDEILDAETEGPGLTIGFNPKFLSEHVRALDENFVTIEFGKRTDPCAFFNSDATERHFVLPVNFVA